MGNRLLAVILLALGGLLSGCGFQRTNAFDTFGSTITVLVELSSKADPIEQDRLKVLLHSEVAEFKGLNPHVQVKLRALPSERLEQELKFRTERGLGPDLLVLANNRDLISFQAQGYISSVQLLPREKESFRSPFLQNLRYRNQQLGLPLLAFAPLACFDRRRLPQPPQTLNDLIRLGQQGHSIGLNSGVAGLYELLSAFNVTLFPHSNTRSSQYQRILRALEWIREANLQPHITFLSDDGELRKGLEAGRFEWVGCSSGWLPTLRRSLGGNLGVAVLPVGPAGPLRPVVRMPIWAFGAQSTARQRQLAMQFVMFASNVVNQRNMALQLGTVLPVNPAIALPLKAYPDLAVMQQAMKNTAIYSLGQIHFFVQHSGKSAVWIDRLINGVDSPSFLAPRLEHLLEAMPTMEGQS